MTRYKVNFVDFIEVLSVANTHKLDPFPAIQDVCHLLSPLVYDWVYVLIANNIFLVGQNQTKIGMTWNKVNFCEFLIFIVVLSVANTHKLNPFPASQTCCLLSRLLML